MKTIDFSYFIERYNAGEMNDAEKQWFRKELEGNEKLRDEVSLRLRTDKVLSNHPSLLLRSKLREIERQRAEAVTAKNPGKHSAIKYAAVISVFILLGSFLLYNGRNMSGNEILEKFSTHFEGISPSRSLESIANDDFKTGLDYYNIRDYSTAATYFSKVLKNNPADMESTMLYGVSKFEQKDYPVAKQSFTTIVDNNSNLYIEDAQWYLALCFIQTDEQESAIEQLKMIINSESIYRKDARKVLKRIR
ncbi:MAG: tetratricopeptide repeat protein [Bacteroidales bacterium]|jgi:tetratricopeptide (TPR) repeat protein|nr:tetratricopeptide repeat protein [Bacteroidales bacterium]